MTKDLIKIIDQNIQSLKSSLGITEAHITWGDRRIKAKYTKIKQRLLMKIREQYIDKTVCENQHEEDYKRSVEFNRLGSLL